MSVSIGPGMISSTRIPNGPTSACSDSPIALDGGFAGTVRAEEREPARAPTTT